VVLRVRGSTDLLGKLTLQRDCVRQLALSGHFTSVRRLFAFFEVNECNGDFATVTASIHNVP